METPQVDALMPKDEQEVLIQNVVNLLCDVKKPSYLKNEKNLKKMLSSMFEVVESAKNKQYAKEVRIQGNKSQNILPFFDGFIDALKQIFPLEEGNGNLEKASLNLLHYLDAYNLLLANMNGYIMQICRMNDSKQFMLGNFATTLLQHLKERLVFPYTQDFYCIFNLLFDCVNYRNDESHGARAESVETSKQRVVYAFSYLIAVNIISYYILTTRNGGVRGTLGKEGSFDLYLYDKKSFSFGVKFPANQVLYEKRFQINFPTNAQAQVGKDTPCKIVFTPADGGTEVVFDNYELRNFSIVPGEFVELGVVPPPVAEKAEEEEEFVGIKSSINFAIFDGKPCQGGTFTGMLDEQQRPHGFGVMKSDKNKYSYTGEFEHGEPVSGKLFTVKSENGLIEFVGILDADCSFKEGVLTEIGDIIRKYSGSFENNILQQGKYFRNGLLMYDGTFAVVRNSDGRKVLTYQGFGVIYNHEEKSVYTGQVAYNLPNGNGWKKYEDPQKPVESGYWRDGKLCAPYPITGMPMPEADAAVAEEPENVEQTEQQVEESPADVHIRVYVNNTRLQVGEYRCGGSPVTPDASGMLLALPGQQLAIKVVRDGSMLPLLLDELEKALVFDVPDFAPGTLTVWNVDEAYDVLIDSLKKAGPLIAYDDVLPDGSHYTGQVDLLGNPQGRGVLVEKSGNVFEGCFVDGLLQGDGQLQVGEKVYKGRFVNGLLEGKVLVFNEGILIHEEIWRKGRFNAIS